MTEPVEKDDSIAFRDEKIRLRFIRKNKKPAGAMRNRKDGEVYWMYPRHAAFPWWDVVDKIDYPFIPKASPGESALIVGDLNDMEKPAFLGPSGISVGPQGVKGGFVEPTSPPTLKGVVSEDFPEVTPTEEWTKKDLLDFIASRGGVGKLEMRKAWLLEIALNLAE